VSRLPRKVILYRQLLELFKVEKQMNDIKASCAPTGNRLKSRGDIDWLKSRLSVQKLQARIVKAQKEGRYGRVKALQWMLTHSFHAKALAVKRVTSNKGSKTAGVDQVL
jgi:RNA-directed DNA polymerase